MGVVKQSAQSSDLTPNPCKDSILRLVIPSKFERIYSEDSEHRAMAKGYTDSFARYRVAFQVQVGILEKRKGH